MTSKSNSAPGFAERHEAELINDQQVLAGQLFLQALQLPLILGLDQIMHQGSRRREAAPSALFDRPPDQAPKRYVFCPCPKVQRHNAHFQPVRLTIHYRFHPHVGSRVELISRRPSPSGVNLHIRLPGRTPLDDPGMDDPAGCPDARGPRCSEASVEGPVGIAQCCR